MTGSKSRTILVTVGTTKFEALVSAVDTTAFLDAALACGYSRIVVQKGSGTYQHRVIPNAGQKGTVLKGSLAIEVLEFVPDLQTHIADADLVVSHAGSGSIFETLTFGKKLIVVPNPLLMDNHQVELGTTLQELGYLVCSSCEDLPRAVLSIDSLQLKPYLKGDCSSLVDQVNLLFNVRP